MVENTYNPNQGKRQLFTYRHPSEQMASLIKAISDGEKPLIMTGAQKLASNWGTQTLKALLKKRFPQKRILRIDSESVSSPDHPAYGCMGNLNAILPLYDIVIASPTIETGVSIDIKGHFTSVWAIAQGTQTVEAVCQELERLRDDVPRHLWAAQRGLSMVGKRETSLPALLKSQDQLCQANIRLLTVAGAGDEFEALDTDFQPESLDTWAKRAILVNRGMWRYREFIIKKLIKEGYEIDPQPLPPTVLHLPNSLLEGGTSAVSPERGDSEGWGEEKGGEGGLTADEIKAEVKQTRQENHQKYCQQVSEAETPSESELAELERRQAKTKPERQRKRKGELVKRYGDDVVTPELVEKDDRGWYAKLRLHYYLTVGAEFLTERDKRSLLKMIKAGDGAVFKPDVNKRLRGAKTKTLEIINITQFLDPEREFTSESLAEWQKTLIAHRHDLKTLTGISINPDKKETPIQLRLRAGERRILNKEYEIKTSKLTTCSRG